LLVLLLSLLLSCIFVANICMGIMAVVVVGVIHLP